ncbi:hypothetical protein B0A48_07710 [Cryoendolithus antarcticus]|uniref:Altered inheritance of mitochondria protein 13, mitochondrial n=1 Tax=Cryoendolithus antarcticus TaxID=1507870 RepID=A0A1V8T7I7_9PEZI|nr:hypothetical protein B0A48_07710 [Cryoendolithus antarcticus]
MGSGSSKPEEHTFNADSPVRFSQKVIDSLQKTPESDRTRAQNTELKIQSRVNEELTRIRDAGAKKLSDYTSSLTTNPPAPGSAAPTNPTASHDPNSLAAHLSSPFYQDHSAGKPAALEPEKIDSGRSHDSVQGQIMDLRKKLDARKKVEKSAPEVDRAREKLVQCLRVNDRRPLDCWEEVEEFKAQVGKLEKKFVAGVGR